jgi:uncharacterized cupredoxin-like copper-binding protein
MRRSVVLVLACLIALGAVGGSQAGASSKAAVKPSTRKIKVGARNFEFDPSKIKVKAREHVTIVLHSEDGPHDFTVQGKGLVAKVGGGKTANGRLSLAKPGKYTFYCSIPGHRSAGMVGTITAS